MHATRPLIAGLALMLSLTACAADGTTPIELPAGTAEPSPSATGTTEPETTDDAAGTIDVTTVPDVITPAYVEAVYAKVIDVHASIINELLSRPADPGQPTSPEQIARLSDVSRGDARASQLTSLDQLATEAASREGYETPYRGPGLRDLTLLYAGERCLIVSARHDFTDAGFTPTAESADWLFALSFVASPRDGSTPSAWLLTKRLANQIDGVPNADEAMTTAVLDDFGDLLEHDCTEADDAR